MNESNSISMELDRLPAAFAILADNTARDCKCLSSEIISDFIDEQLSESEKLIAQAKIARCADCYNKWFVATEALAFLNSESSSSPEVFIGRSFIENLIAHWKTWLGGAATGLVALSIVINLAPTFIRGGQLPVGAISDDLIATVAERYPSDSHIAQQWPWLQSHKNFSWSGTLTQKDQSGYLEYVNEFKFGILKGQSELNLDSDFWLGIQEDYASDYADNPLNCSKMTEVQQCQESKTVLFELGRWAMAMYSLCNVNPRY